MRTLERLHQYINDINIILVLPKQHQDYWKLLCSEYNFAIAHKVVDGGKERFFSVKNALDSIDINEDAIVGIHDGVRPFVDLIVIETQVGEYLGEDDITRIEDDYQRYV